MRSETSKIDHSFLWITLILVGIGLVMIFSATTYLTFIHAKDPFVYLRHHLIRLGIGLFALFMGVRIRYTLWRHLIPIFVLASLLLLFITLIFGKVAGGARRWIEFFRFTLQPSEFVKIGLVFYLAGFFASRQEEGGTFSSFVLPPLFITSVIVLLIAFQPNIGTAIGISLLAGVLFFAGGVKLRHLFLIGILGLLCFGILILSSPHAKARVTGFISKSAYQVHQSIIAIGSGGIFGNGLGESKQKFLFLPKLHTDFIFSILAEETGFLGSLLVFFLFLAFLFKGLGIAKEAPDRFGLLTASGLSAMVFLYFILHTGVAMGVFPPTGLPLPFISFGGSALIANLFSVGVILNISKYRQKRRIDEDSLSSRWNRRTYLSRYRSE